MTQNKRIVIIGGGLSGLTLAYLLSKAGVQAQIIEASDRIGGRIHTYTGKLGTPLELGATWFSDAHVHLLALLDALKLRKYPQYAKGITLFQTKSFEPPQQFHIPESQEPSYRIVGGTREIINALYGQLNPALIHLGAAVIKIEDKNDGLLLNLANGEEMRADLVVMAMPIPLIAEQLTFKPSLPEELTHLLPTVQTWMAGSIKFVLEYDRPFWREQSYSGMLFSHSGIVTEMYDHTNYERNKFGFTGFLNGGAAAYSQAIRKEYVLKQLSELLGPKILEAVTYEDKVWNNTFIAAGDQKIQRPHQNNGHPLLQQSYLNNKLYFCGTETSSTYPGYMEGAIISAKQTFEKLNKA